jgi:HD-GYP domain-containing protein (c-di-GMP phosphodiesterase class II)
MVTERNYRAAMSHEGACQELRRCAGAQFDPAVVEAFLEVIAGAGDQSAFDDAHTAAAHVRTLLERE